MALHRVHRLCHCQGIRLTLLAVAAIGLIQVTGAEASTRSPQKPAWEWSVDERLAVRLDPLAIESRAIAHRATTVNSSSAAEKRHAVDTIHGNETPELFLTWELFDHLVNLGFPTDGSDHVSTRHLIEARAAVLGFGRDMWRRLEVAASPLLEFRREELAARYRVDMIEGDTKALFLCQVRSQSLAAAMKEFGKERFLSLLYGAVAPTFSRTYIVEEGLADHLRFIEGGCK